MLHLTIQFIPVSLETFPCWPTHSNGLLIKTGFTEQNHSATIEAVQILLWATAILYFIVIALLGPLHTFSKSFPKKHFKTVHMNLASWSTTTRSMVITVCKVILYISRYQKPASTGFYSIATINFVLTLTGEPCLNFSDWTKRKNANTFPLNFLFFFSILFFGLKQEVHQYTLCLICQHVDSVSVITLTARHKPCSAWWH